MIKVNSIIKAISSSIYKGMDSVGLKDKITDDEEQLQLYLNKDNGCFFIDVHMSSAESVNLHFNKKEVIVDIKYYPTKSNSKKRFLYDVKDMLESTFVRSIKVDKRVLHISNIDSLILRDDISFWVNFSIKLEYHEQAYFKADDSEIMKDIKLKYNDNLHIDSEV